MNLVKLVVLADKIETNKIECKKINRHISQQTHRASLSFKHTSFSFFLIFAYVHKNKNTWAKIYEPYNISLG